MVQLSCALGVGIRARDALVGLAEDGVPLPGAPVATGAQVEGLGGRRGSMEDEPRSFMGEDGAEGQDLAALQFEFSDWCGRDR